MTEQRKSVWERIDDLFREQADAALEQYREGADAVSFDFGPARLSFSDLKNNDERERVRLTLPELLEMLRGVAVAGASMACSAMAHVAARQAGFVLADPDKTGEG